MGTLGMAAGQTLNVTGANNYGLRFTGTNFTGTGNFNFTPASGLSVAVVGNGPNTGRVPVNTGAGTLLLGGTFGQTSGTSVTTPPRRFRAASRAI
jgi:hypothetical protein